MRTKTMLLSALLGTLGSVAVMAQSTNVYSLNAVGYINVTCYPGFNIVSCPLICSPDNTIATVFPNPAGNPSPLWKVQIWNYNPLLGNPYAEDVGGKTGGWEFGGTNYVSPGQAVWFYNPSNFNYTITMVGTVPSSNSTTLYPQSYNLVSSAIPASGDITTNGLMLYTNAVKLDYVYTYNPTVVPPTSPYLQTIKANGTAWSAGDPQELIVGGGFWYFNHQATNNYWVQTYSVTN